MLSKGDRIACPRSPSPAGLETPVTDQRWPCAQSLVGRGNPSQPSPRKWVVQACEGAGVWWPQGDLNKKAAGVPHDPLAIL
jgi:hypothetical protein